MLYTLNHLDMSSWPTLVCWLFPEIKKKHKESDKHLTLSGFSVKSQAWLLLKPPAIDIPASHNPFTCAPDFKEWKKSHHTCKILHHKNESPLITVETHCTILILYVSTACEGLLIMFTVIYRSSHEGWHFWSWLYVNACFARWGFHTHQPRDTCYISDIHSVVE